MSEVSKNKTVPPLYSLVAGALAGGVEAAITYPTEFVKTQLQLQSKAVDAKRYKGPVDCAVQIVREKGISGLYRGLSALVIGTAAKAGVRFYAYESFKQVLADKNGRLTSQNILLAGLGAGVTEAVLVVTPTETIKTKLIDDANRSTPKYKGLVHGVRAIIAEEGIGGVYRGLTSVVLRQSANQAVRLSVYGVLKEAVQGKYPKDATTGKELIPWYTTFALGAIAGTATVYATGPLDVLKTRMQGLDARRLYKNSLHCIYRVIKDDGFFALWKGAVPRLGRLVLSGGLVFTGYEITLNMLLRAFPLHAQVPLPVTSKASVSSAPEFYDPEEDSCHVVSPFKCFDNIVFLFEDLVVNPRVTIQERTLRNSKNGVIYVFGRVASTTFQNFCTQLQPTHTRQRSDEINQHQSSQYQHLIRLCMDFSDQYRQSNCLVQYSPNGLHILTAVQHRVVVRDSDSLQIQHLFACIDNVSDIGWSADSQLILCANYKLGAIQIWRIREHAHDAGEVWTCRIDEGAGGLANVRFTPDGRHVLSFSEFHLRITVWSLVTKEAAYIQYPKYTDRAYSFRSDSRYLAVAERRDCKEYVGIYDCDDWTMLKHFPIETNDLEDISWSPDGRFLAIWETCIEYKVLLYYPDGRVISAFTPCSMGLGIKTVKWSPSSQFLAVGGYDQRVRLLNHYTWSHLVDFSHPCKLESPDILVFREADLRDIRDADKWAQAASLKPKIRYEVSRPPLTVPSSKPDPDKPNPKMGVGLLEFSCDGRHFVTRNDNMPNVLWIWNLPELRQVALIIQLHAIKTAKWSPMQPECLVFTCGTSALYLWGGEKVGCDVVEIPAVNFNVASFRWAPDSKSLALLDKEKFCIAYPLAEDDRD
ncbi:hypothetical protein SeMB42_g00189 [Synchytrium endobioticum]|uniref:Translation initiation factor beta propellor-like domain-containing protein n=1 Tax=Synchytrium endobioticum TaxID=286115 RepID=A0A507DSC7_9FUNG|nr:hypothetical protein SeMB42_g00189 [Synchytrium endobioticum]